LSVARLWCRAAIEVDRLPIEGVETDLATCRKDAKACEKVLQIR